MQTFTVVKIGGNVIDSPAELAAFLTDFARLPEPKILVHGGGVMANGMLERLGIEPKMVDGRRITDEQTLRVVAMVYAGWINKSIVGQLQADGCDALGLSGADGNSVRATRRPPLPFDYGYAGDVAAGAVNVPFIISLASSGITPVFCSLTHDGQGQLLNTNADTMASVIASALCPAADVRLIYCFEKRGVLADPGDDGSVIDTLCHCEYLKMKAHGRVKAGMIAKLDNAFSALRQGVGEVWVKHAGDICGSGGTKLKL